MTTGNPVLPGHYADPELHLFQGSYWIYPTVSTAYDEQSRFVAFSSMDLRTWSEPKVILDLRDLTWGRPRCAWAPSVAEKDGRYYFYFSVGDGDGIGVGVSDKPDGPFTDPLGRPLVGEYHHGAQPIDAHAFIDDDGRAYLYWGGWSRAVACPLGEDMISLAGEIRKITPERYVEGPFMLRRNGVYVFMWSEGSWGDATYNVAWGRADSPFGPFPREGEVFLPNTALATSAGHHSVLQIPGSDEWVLAYHRRAFGETARDARVTCLEDLRFDEGGAIQPVAPSSAGAKLRPLSPAPDL